MGRAWRLAARLIAALLVAATVLAPSPVSAGWMSRLGRLVDDAGTGGSALRHAVPGDDLASAFTRHLKALPSGEVKGAALAAHATPEGHWRFANRDGEVFTAANATEIERAIATLLPEGAARGPIKLRLFLTEASVFERSAALKNLPDAEFHMLAENGKAYRLVASSKAASGFAASVRGNARVELGDRRAFEEALFQLGRPLKRTSIRVISLEPGARHTLPAVPRIDGASKSALVDVIDPWKLPAALSSIKGQTLVLVGRVEGSLIHFKAAGAERALDLDELLVAAKAADVDVVVMHASNAAQPGGSNWLWQTVEIKGLGNALERDNFGDFLDALGAGRGGLAVDVSAGATGRTRLDVVPAGAHSGPITGALGNWASDLTANVLGNVVVEAVKVDAVNRERRRELELRLVPGIPSALQWIYLGGIVSGLIGFQYSFAWWRRIWPREERSEYAGMVGYWAARTVRGLAFVLLFLPVAGAPAGIAALAIGALQQVWAILTAPFRVLRWLSGKLRPARS